MRIEAHFMEQTKQEDQKELQEVGAASLVYEPSKVSWAVSQHIAKENPVLSRVLVYCLGALFFLSLAYGALSKVAVSVNAPGSLEFDFPLAKAMSPYDLTVNELYVSDNQQVQKGALILKAKDQIEPTEQKNIFAAQKEVQRLLAQSASGTCHAQCIAAFEKVTGRSFGLDAKLKMEGPLGKFLSDVSKNLNEHILALKEMQKSAGYLAGLKGQITQLQQKLRIIERRKAKKILKFEYDQLSRELASLQSEYNEKQSVYEREVQSTRKNLEVLLADVKKNVNEYIESHEIRSPASGVIVFENLRVKGEFISARTPLFQILPSQSNLKGKLTLSGRDISKVKLKDKVKMNLHALPERDYAALYGEVERISASPTVDQKTGAITYEVHVKLNQQGFLSTQGEKKEFKYGMTLDAKVITKYESLLNLGIRKLLNLYDQYIKWN